MRLRLHIGSSLVALLAVGFTFSPADARSSESGDPPTALSPTLALDSACSLIRGDPDRDELHQLSDWATAELARLQDAGLGDPVSIVRVTDVLVEAQLRLKWKYLETIADLDSVRRFAERALAIREQMPNTMTAGLFDSIVSLAKLHGVQGNHQERHRLMERARGLVTNSLPGDADTARREIGVLANYYRTWDSWDAAVDLQKLDLQVCERAFGAQSVEAAKSARLVARELHYAGRTNEAVSYLARALETYELRGDSESPDVSNALNLRAVIRMSEGDYSSARSDFSRALELRKHALDPKAAEALAALLGPEGPAQHSVVEAYLSTADSTQRTPLSEVGQSYSNLGELASLEGDLLAEERDRRRTLLIWSRVRPLNDADSALARVALGNTLLSLGKESGALTEFEQAIRDLGADGREQHEYYAFALLARATLNLNRGRLDPARRDAENALRILEPRYGATLGAPGLEALETLARIDLLEGQPEAALTHATRAEQDRLRQFGDGDPSLALDLTLRAKALAALGQSGAALDLALQGSEMSTRKLGLIAGSLPQVAALRYAEANSSALDALLGIAETCKCDVDWQAVWNQVIRSRARVLDGLAQRNRRLSFEGNASTRALADQLAAARARLAAVTLQGPAGGGGQTYPARVRELTEACNQLERDLAKAMPTVGAEARSDAAGLTEILGELPKDSTLVGYVRFGAPDAQYGAFVARAGSTEPSFVSLGSAKRVDDLIRRWRATTASAPPALASRASDALRSTRVVGENLRRLVWDPISEVVSKEPRPRLVLVVPEGPLNFVNFAALPATRPHRWMLEDGPTFQFLSAERDLARLESEPPKPTSLLAVGGPDFDETPTVSSQQGVPQPTAMSTSLQAGPSTPELPPQPESIAFRGSTSSCVDFLKHRFEPLPGARLEASRVAAIWKSAVEGEHAHASGDSAVLQGAQAGETQFRLDAPRFSVVHVATHGFLVDEPLSKCAVERAGGDDSSSEGTLTLVTVSESPLLRSGLAFAGANQTLLAARPGKRAPVAPAESQTPGSAGIRDADDGILTAEEIASMDMSGVRSVVLSACETGSGPVQTGEGVLGLRRAFTIAGARSLVMSLWHVGDNATLTWMPEFYRALLHGQGTGESVRQASLRALRARRSAGQSEHPFYWAPFVASGDWR